MTYNVHLAFNLDEMLLTQLRSKVADDVQLTCGEMPENPAYHMLVTGRPSREQLDTSPNLQALVIPFAGMPAPTRETMRDYPHVAIHNLHHNAAPTAEMALALLMACARTLMPADRRFREGDWRPRYDMMPWVLLAGKTALILGYGAIGEHLGKILRVMGMDVIGTRRRRIDEDAGIYPPDALHDLLPRADVLVIALPGVPETEDLIGAQELAALPQNAIVVNIGRGSVLNQHALYDALARGHLHAAGLDVWYNYPPDEQSRSHTMPSDAPLHELDNIVMSPHRAGGFGNDELEILRMNDLARLINAAANGDPIPNRVDLDLGY